MAIPDSYSYPRTRLGDGLMRDLAAVLLLLIMVAGLSTAAFFTDWRLGLATLSLASGVAGGLLAYRR